MKIIFDTDDQTLTELTDGTSSTYPLFGPESFSRLSHEWMRIGWSLKYYHRFTWLGYPVLQLPEDMVHLQEAIFSIKPDVIVETGVYAGGSLAFEASICEVLGKGKVIGIDIELKPQARKLVEDSPLAHRITLIEGDSSASSTLRQVLKLIQPGDVVMVILDSHHTAEHVAKELEMYSPLVTAGSCLLVADAVMKDLADVPGGEPSWVWDNPGTAVDQFIENHPEFERREYGPVFNESPIGHSATYWPDGWLWRQT